MMPGPKIAIIGAGPGGLTLARLLQKHGLPCTVYEGEPDRRSRNQGGTLDLHPKLGQRALAEAGLLEEFKKHARPEGEAMKLVRYDGAVLWDENAIGNTRPEEFADRPEIDRVALRDILLDSLEPGVIQWGKKIVKVEPDARSKGKWTLDFGTHIEREIDLVAGADGAWSKVRRLLSDTKPFYSGITAVELWALDVEKKNPWLAEYIGQGSCFMFDEGRALQCQRNGNGSVRAYASVRQPLSWSEDCGIDWTQPGEAREALIKAHFADCGADIQRVIRECRDELIIRQMFMLPVGFTWAPRAGVTLLGDAAHLMTPFAGIGVNAAMADALQLAQALVAKKDSVVAKAFSDERNINAAVQTYEKQMFERTRENAQKTWENMHAHFSKGGAEERAGKFRKHYELKKAEEAKA